MMRYKPLEQSTYFSPLPTSQSIATRTRSLIITGLFAIFSICGATAVFSQEGTVKAQYGEWQVVCKKPAGAKKEICAAVQSVTAEDRPNVGLTVYLQKFHDGKKVLRVFVPLGILLPTGVGLKIDDIDVGHAPFLRCHSFACYAQVTADEKLLSKLSNGKTAMFIIFQTEEAGIGIPVSLNGLKTAMKSLK